MPVVGYPVPRMSGDEPTTSENPVTRALFLACSWTWCIGMFFPVYLISDFGVWGWVAFAVPNVLGAGAMGWVLRRPGASERLTHRHAPAARWFSIVTILFHLCVLSWLFGHSGVTGGGVLDPAVQGPTVAIAALGLGLLFGAMRTRGWMLASVSTYILSIVMAYMAWQSNHSALALPNRPPVHGLTDLLLASVAMVFGFALCPYLDLTFHRVRREVPGTPGVAAFAVGFAVFFLPLITLTLFYAAGLSGEVPGPFSAWLLGNFFGQAVFTIGAHARELMEIGLFESPRSWVPAPARRRAVQAAAAVGLALPMVFGVLLNDAGLLREGYSIRRLSYELFMSFYGLVFPAYVWIVIIERGMPGRLTRTGWLFVLPPAAACFWLGYIEQQYIWLLPGVGLPILTPAVLRAVSRKAR